MREMMKWGAICLCVATFGCAEDSGSTEPIEPDVRGLQPFDLGPDTGPKPDVGVDAESDVNQSDVAVDAAPAAQCADGLDNDEDGETDFPEDRGCASADDDNEGDDPPPECADGVDNDGDGRVDLADTDCVNGIDPTEDGADPLTACGNTLDDDADGVADFPLDPGCGAAGDDDETDPIVARACANGEDDDGDGLTDYPNDPGCAGRGDPDETDPRIAPACSNNIDDDGDGAIDFPDDQGCESAGDTDEASTCGAGRPIRDLNAAVGDLGYVDGDLTEGVPGFTGSCGGAAGPELVYAWRVNAPLRTLRFSTTSDETLVPTVMYVRRTCTGATDLACDRGAAIQTGATVVLNDVQVGTYYVVIDTGSRVAGPGAFRLRVEEDSAPHCQDGADNDDDGLIDLNDPGCVNSADEDEADPPEPPVCSDGIDNDGDNLTDYPADPECEAAGADREGPLCEIDVPVAEIGGRGDAVFAEFSETSVSDGSCRGGSGGEFVVALTLDTLSDVRVTLGGGVPAAAASVYVRSACDVPDTEVACSENVRSPLLIPELPAGRHFLFVDLHGAPPAAMEVSVSITSLITVCNDEIDNDMDGLIDLFDPGCTGIRDGNERDPASVPQCGDGLDNDADGLIDYPDDDGCIATGDVDEAPECMDVIPQGEVGVDGGNVAFDTSNAEVIPNECGQGGAAVIVLRLTRGASLDAEVTGADFDSKLELRAACDDVDSGIQCDDDGGAGTLSRVQLERLEPGTYFLIVSGFRANSTGPGTLEIRTVPDDVPPCADDVDNDGDGLVDFDDPGCEGSFDQNEDDPAMPPACADGADNDGDGLVDYPDDLGCGAAGGTSEIGHCEASLPIREVPAEGGSVDVVLGENGASLSTRCGQGVGLETVIPIDLSGPSDLEVTVLDGDEPANALVSVRRECDVGASEISCSSTGGRMSVGELDAGLWYVVVEARVAANIGATWTAQIAATPVVAACSDGEDNDADGAIDAADPGCLDRRDDDESDPESPAECSDGQDNDEDGQVDFPDDAECSAAGALQEGLCGTLNVVSVAPEGGRYWLDPVEGDSVFEGSCGDGRGAEAVLAVDVPVLSNIQVSATTAAGTRAAVFISVRAGCGEDDFENGCLRSAGAHPLAVDFLEPGRYYIIIDRPGALANGRLAIDVVVESQIGECNDEIDNDDDGAIDVADPGCAFALDPSEADPAEPAACSDTEDNDEDGLIDWPMDTDCFAAGDENEAPHCLQVETITVGPEGGVFEVDPAGNGDLYRGECARSEGPEVVFSFTLAAPSPVNIAVTAAAYDAALYLRTECEVPESAVACNDTTVGPPRSQRPSIVLDELPAGSYFLILDGNVPGRDGSVTIEFDFEAPPPPEE